MKEFVPVLRFSEFEGEWMEMKLGDYFNVNMCKRIFANETREYGDVPFYKIGTLGKEPDAYISRELFETYKAKYKYPRTGAVLISCSGTVGKCVVFNGEDSYYQDSNIVWLENNEELISDIFLYLLLIKVDWSRLNSTTITRIYSSDLKGVRVKYPNLVEQTKIANFLSAVDEQISLLTEKQEKLQTYKRGVMQKLFSQELRFKDEHGEDYPEWEEKKLGEIVICLNSSRKPINSIERNQRKGIYPYWGANNIVDYLDDFTIDDEVVLLAEDGGNFAEYKTKPIANYFVGKCWVNNHTHILKGDNEKLLTKFLFYSVVHKDVNKYITGGTRSKLTKNVMFQIEILVPSPPEQAKIANFLTAIDGQLEEVEAQIVQTRVFKQGLLQKMFV